MPGVTAPFDLRDHIQVATFRQHHVGAREEVERPGDFGFSAACALRDRRQLAVLARQQGDDPVRLAVVEPVQDDGIGVIGRHGCNSTVAMARCPVIVRVRLLGRTLAAIVVATTLTPVAATADWPTYHLDPARTGNAAGQPFTRSLTNSWSRAVDGQVYAEPLVAGNRVLIATENNSIYSLDPATGEIAGRARTGHDDAAAAAAGCVRRFAAAIL